MNKINFVICCKFYNNSIFDCVESILKYHKDANIIIVDSASENKDYFNKLSDVCTIENINNKNYMTGAIWHCFEKFNYDNYFFIQDSVIIKSNLSFLLEKNVCSVRYFISGDILNGFPKGNRWGQGFDNFEQKQFVQNSLTEHTEIKIPKEFTGLFGPMMFCKRHILENLKSKWFHKIIPHDKLTSCGMERAWGIALQYLEIGRAHV